MFKVSLLKNSAGLFLSIVAPTNKFYQKLLILYTFTQNFIPALQIAMYCAKAVVLHVWPLGSCGKLSEMQISWADSKQTESVNLEMGSAIYTVTSRFYDSDVQKIINRTLLHISIFIYI